MLGWGQFLLLCFIAAFYPEPFITVGICLQLKCTNLCSCQSLRGVFLFFLHTQWPHFLVPEKSRVLGRSNSVALDDVKKRT
ncbi:hypothetical protein V5799_004514 [Amblyomma americanum]|uniref:Secreted protein n=1 Tax=Amblyomma americanum TaxID=6943 RepID=A0AAQ4D5W0_AMBAM